MDETTNLNCSNKIFFILKAINVFRNWKILKSEFTVIILFYNVVVYSLQLNRKNAINKKPV